jgi:ribosome-binding factor A
MALCLWTTIFTAKRIIDMQYQRKDRVGDLVKREISQMLQQELKDPGIGFVTITGAEVSADLKRARIYYSVWGDEDSKKESASALKRACGFIQREIGKRLRLKYTPEISFKFDASVEYGAHIEELIQKIHQHDKADQDDSTLSQKEKDEG